jgi:hypothetical protein
VGAWYLLIAQEIPHQLQFGLLEEFAFYGDDLADADQAALLPGIDLIPVPGLKTIFQVGILVLDLIEKGGRKINDLICSGKVILRRACFIQANGHYQDKN